MEEVGTGVGGGAAERPSAQVCVGVREAAKIARVSEKRIRRWIRDGTIRADLVEGKFGRTYAVEVASLPPPSAPLRAAIPEVGQGGPLVGEGSGKGAFRGEAAVAAGLLRMLAEKDGRLEVAVGRIGYLEAQAEQVRLLEARAESLARREQEVRAQAAEAEQREAAARGQTAAVEQEARSLRSALFWHRLLLWLSIAALAAGGIWLRLAG